MPVSNVISGTLDFFMVVSFYWLREPEFTKIITDLRQKSLAILVNVFKIGLECPLPKRDSKKFNKLLITVDELPGKYVETNIQTKVYVKSQ